MSINKIIVRGARQHNLRNGDIDIPREITGERLPNSYSVCRDLFQKHRPISPQILVNLDLSGLLEDTRIHGFGMQINPTIIVSPDAQTPGVLY